MRKIAIILSLLIFVVYCDQKAQKKILTGTFLFLKGDVLLNSKNAKLGATIKQTDLIVVKEKSRAVLQLNNSLVIQMRANSILQISKLDVINKNNVIETMQRKGTVFHKLTPGSNQYKVRTPTVTAAVRGTAFQLSIKKKNVEVRLLTGEVSVSNNDESKSVDLKKNQKVTAKGNKLGKVKKLSKKDKASLKKLNQVTASSTNEEIKAIIEASKTAKANDKSSKGKTKKKAKKVTIDDLRKKYGTLTKVTTKDGKTYIGAYHQVGSNVVVITTSGKKKVPSVNVKKVTPY